RRSTPNRFLNLLRVANLSTLALLPCVTSSILSRLVGTFLTRLTCFLGEPVNGFLVKCLHNELDSRVLQLGLQALLLLNQFGTLSTSSHILLGIVAGLERGEIFLNRNQLTSEVGTLKNSYLS